MLSSKQYREIIEKHNECFKRFHSNMEFYKQVIDLAVNDIDVVNNTELSDSSIRLKSLSSILTAQMENLNVLIKDSASYIDYVKSREKPFKAWKEEFHFIPTPSTPHEDLESIETDALVESMQQLHTARLDYLKYGTDPMLSGSLQPRTRPDTPKPMSEFFREFVESQPNTERVPNVENAIYEAMKESEINF